MTHADDTTASGQYHLLGVNFKRTQFTPVEEEVVPVVDEKAKWWEPIEEQWIKIEKLVTENPKESLIIGAGSLLGIIVICVVCCCCSRERRRQRNKSEASKILSEFEEKISHLGSS